MKLRMESILASESYDVLNFKETKKLGPADEIEDTIPKMFALSRSRRGTMRIK